MHPMHRAFVVAALVLLAAPAAFAHRDDGPSVDDRLRAVEALLDQAVATGRLDALHEARVQVARARADLRVPASTPTPTMSAAAQAALHDQLRRAPYDSSRVTLLKGVRHGMVFTVSEVADVLVHFTTDGGRVEAVKALRDVVVDPQNRVLLLSTLQYESSRVAVLDLWRPPTRDRA
jgi:hypothetical protein